MMSQDRRSGLYRELSDVMRESASRTLMLHQVIAERFGLGPTDIKALDLARDEPRLTAGRLAELTGLSTSSVTALLDRLEKRGLVRRERDPADRRRVIVVPTNAHHAEGVTIFAGIEKAVHELLDGYTEEQLETFLDLARRLNVMSAEYTATLAQESARRHPAAD